MILHATSTPTHIYFIHTKKDNRSAASSCSSTAADLKYRHERLMKIECNPSVQRGRSCSWFYFLDVVRQPIAVAKAFGRHCSSLVALGLMIPVLFFFCRLLQNYSLALTQGLFKLVASGNPFPFVQFIQN